ncbi:MAG TPA: hypothetical protein VLS93_18575 [Anaeromyxobacteraceae bacterium]|nr:hypothetical protein [Anaeromyxobacteraceae bacterium]
MPKALALACSLALVVLGQIYSRSDGLFIDVLPSGEVVRSNALQSSGSNDAFLVGAGFGTFVVSAGAAFLALVGILPARWLRWIYLGNVAVLAFLVFLVNLDTSIVRSIRLGDFLLLGGLLAAVLPLPFLFRRAAARRPS